MALDIQLFHLLNNLAGQSPFVDQIIVFCASYLAYILIAIFFGLLLFAHYSRNERRTTLIVAVASAIVARFGVTEFIRVFIHRPRPFLVETPIHQLLTDPAWSFPSGHATFFFALATAVYLYHKRWGVFFFIAAAVVSLGRVAAGVHYPSDILAGALVGVLVSLGITAYIRRFKAISSVKTLDS
jgi:undecaprenyl-diphosphatase